MDGDAREEFLPAYNWMPLTCLCTVLFMGQATCRHWATELNKALVQMLKELTHCLMEKENINREVTA